MRYVERNGIWVPEKRGLGDSIAMLTKKLGISECGGCSKRRAWLNRVVPYKTKRSWPSHPIAGGIAGEEQRCTELGSNCICSEPFQMTSFTVTSGAFYDPNDSITKPCGFEAAVPTAPLVTNAPVVVSSDPIALSRLPAGHSVERFARVDNFDMNVGHGATVVPPSFARVALRYYEYRSPDFDFNGDNGGACFNSKFANGGKIGQQLWNTDMDVGGNIHILNVEADGNTFTPPVSCCTSGPGPNSFQAGNYEAWRGKWWRIEIIMVGRDTNPAAPFFDLIIYGKNVTDNTPEITIIKLSDAFANLTPVFSDVSWMAKNGHRGGTCRGWQAISHMLYAAWSTDAGQRILGAYEVEGGLPLPPTPSFPILVGGGVAFQGQIAGGLR